MNKNDIKLFSMEHTSGLQLLSKGLLHVPFLNNISVKGKGNRIETTAICTHCSIKIKGKNNVIHFGNLTRLTGLKISIRGNNNRIFIGDRCGLNDCRICIEDDQNLVELGDRTGITGLTRLSCIEGSAIRIGSDCMFSAEIDMRTGDSHSILDAACENRINPSKDIRIGDHVWIGYRVIILKGVEISDASIVGTGSVVTKSFTTGHSIIAGNPARLVKSGIDWCQERITI